MKISALLSFLSRAFNAPRPKPILITGAPGLGKSDAVQQAAEAAGADLILSHPAVADPTDAKGLPWIAPDSSEATFLPFGELAAAMRAERRTVWFLDDLGQASPAVQASYMQLLLARRVNGHVLPDCVTFVAATNRRTDRAGVSGILEPVKSRFASIVELEADISDWSRWALANDIPAELVAFLRFRPDLLSDFNASADLTNSPSPRTWSNAAWLLSLDLPKAERAEALAGAVGSGAATEFLAFLEMFRQLPSIDAILIDADSAIVPAEPSARYAVCTALAARAGEAAFPRVARYAERLQENGAGDFAALLIRDVIRRIPAVQHTPAFARIASGEMASLITGS
ncbi:MAG: ATP-binding protein [Pigmentiphaga sp.]|nr:ATP-binding protein [Pigmentiphaga sp.]